jgi:ribonuclease Z
MSERELVVLGTASQSPTRYRNHNGYLLRWAGHSVLFDPGEGTQRQLLLAGVSPTSIRQICVTHFHGDHSLGLPGILQRLSLDRVTHPVQVLYPASGQEYFERLRFATSYQDHLHLEPRPVAANGPVLDVGPFVIHAGRLDHEPETFGWRLVEPEKTRIDNSALARLGIAGPAVGELIRTGTLSRPAGGGGPEVVRLDEVSRTHPGQVMAFVMDTGICDEAVTLARKADLLVCESTFCEADRHLARQYRHLTAQDAARIAREAGARRLVLTHFSQRYPDARLLLEEARAVFDDVVLAEDLARIPMPERIRI